MIIAAEPPCILTASRVKPCQITPTGSLDEAISNLVYSTVVRACQTRRTGPGVRKARKYPSPANSASTAVIPRDRSADTCKAGAMVDASNAAPKAPVDRAASHIRMATGPSRRSAARTR